MHLVHEASRAVQRTLESYAAAEATGRVSGAEASIGKRLVDAACRRSATAFRVCAVDARDLQIAVEGGDLTPLRASKALAEAVELFAARLGKIGSRVVSCCEPLLAVARYGYTVLQFGVAPLPGSTMGDKREEVLALLCIVNKHGCLHGIIVPWTEAVLRNGDDPK